MAHFSIKTEGLFSRVCKSILSSILLLSFLAMTCDTANGCNFQDETFDGYPNGSSMHGQGGWEGWEGNPAATALVTQSQSLSPLQSVDINGDSDLVQSFCASGGAWSYSAWHISLPILFPVAVLNLTVVFLFY